MKLILLTTFGYIFLGLGIIGVFLPVWPTTPFVLVSVACFSSSPKTKAKIMNIPFFREHIENYHQRKGLSRKTFIRSMLWLWSTLLISIVIIDSLYTKVLLVFIGSMVTWHLYSMSKPKEDSNK